MKRNISIGMFTMFSLVLILLVLSFVQCSTIATEPENNKTTKLSKTEEEIVTSSTDFGFDLLKELLKKETNKNIIISPLSVSTAFGMTLNGAKGNTYSQIKSTIGLAADNQTDINESYQSLNKLLTGMDNKVDFSCANSIWYRTGFSVESDFLNSNKNYFDAEVSELDFSNASVIDIINNWVKQSTKDKIEKIIERIDAGVVMYVINAIYFKGTWKYQFDSKVTFDGNFNVNSGESVTCKMMKQKNTFNYFENANYQAIQLPYGDGYYNMAVILPRDIASSDNIIDNFTQQDFNTVRSNLTEKELTLYFPKFKLEYEKSLNAELINMGMIDGFDPAKADFSGIHKNGGIYISEVKHKTFVEVNEEGTEAAAVTSIEFTRSSIDPNELFFRIDRPFLFIIYEANTNAILFLGKIVNPLEA